MTTASGSVKEITRPVVEVIDVDAADDKFLHMKRPVLTKSWRSDRCPLISHELEQEKAHKVEEDVDMRSEFSVKSEYLPASSKPPSSIPSSSIRSETVSKQIANARKANRKRPPPSSFQSSSYATSYKSEHDEFEEIDTISSST